MKNSTVLLFLTLLTFLSSSAADAGIPNSVAVEVHFVAADFAYFSYPQSSNQNLIFRTTKGGYDAVWRGRLGTAAFVPDKVLVRNASGESRQVSYEGRIDCDGHLSYYTEPIVSIVRVNGPVVSLAVSTPLTSNNTGGPAATLADRTPGLLAACNTGFHSYEISTPPGNLYFLPKTVYPFDTTPTSQAINHGNQAIIDVNLNSPEASTNYSYSYSVDVPNTDGSVYQHTKLVWFGTLTVNKLSNQEIPRAVDPFSLRGYQPGDISSQPNDPPVAPVVPTKSMITNWLRSLSDTAKFSLQDLAEDFDRTNSVRARSAVLPDSAVRFISYETSKRILTIAQSSASPLTGSVATTIRVGSSNGTIFAKQVSDAKSTKVKLASGSSVTLRLVLTPAGAAIIKKGLAATLYLKSVASGSSPKISVDYSAKFKVAARKK